MYLCEEDCLYCPYAIEKEGKIRKLRKHVINRKVKPNKFEVNMELEDKDKDGDSKIYTLKKKFKSLDEADAYRDGVKNGVRHTDLKIIRNMTSVT